MTPRDLLTTLFELLCLAAIVFGVYLYDPRAALIVGGVLGAALAYALAAPPARGPDQ